MFRICLRVSANPLVQRIQKRHLLYGGIFENRFRRKPSEIEIFEAIQDITKELHKGDL